MSPAPHYSKETPFFASVKERYRLNKPGSQKETHHLVIDLKDSGIAYQAGDCIAILPTNPPLLVEKTLKAMRASGDELVFDKRSSQNMLLRDLLTQKANITKLNRSLLKIISNSKAAMAHLFEPAHRDELEAYLESHEVWDALTEHADIHLTPQETCDHLTALLPRFYSIASSMKAVGEELHLTVAHVRYESNGIPRYGVCTNYLCDQVPLNEKSLPIYIQKAHAFQLPQDHSAPIIMIGPGTGVAPYRAFMQERLAYGAEGQNWLFFGEWNRAYDFFYEEFWSELEKAGKLRIDTAFSRDQPHKVYVQHRMLENSRELWQWLEEGAYLFVCGDAKSMAKDVETALHQIVQEEGKMDRDAAKAYIKQLRHNQRYLRDVY